MSDISKSQIARLVLGYLKEENRAAYKYFLNQSPHLEKFRNKNYRICTRLNGFTLEEILLQYSEINLILHAKLESTEFFQHNTRQNADLPRQLVYILNTKTEQSSRESSPFSECQYPNDDSIDVTSNSLSLTPRTANLNVNSSPVKSLPGKPSAKRKEIKVVIKCPKQGKDNLEYSEEHRNTFAEMNEFRTCLSGVTSIKQSMNACSGFQKQIAKTVRLADETKTVFNQCSEAVDAAVKSFSGKSHNDSIFDKVLNELLDLAPTQSNKEKKDENHLNAQKNQANLSLSNSPAMVTITPLVIENADMSYQQFGAEDSKQIVYIKDPTTGEESEYIVDMNLSEQDIMSLPVILEDDGKLIMEQPPQVPKKRVKTLLPIKNRSQSVPTSGDNTEDIYLQHPQSSTIEFHDTKVAKEEYVEESEATGTLITPDSDGQSTNETTPRSSSRSSHVRALDFKFQTPAKPANANQSSPKSSKPHQKTVKSLFTEESAKNEKKSGPAEPWDHNFRKIIKHDPNINPPFTLAKSASANENVDSSNLAKNSAKKYSKKSAKTGSSINETTAKPGKSEVPAEDSSSSQQFKEVVQFKTATKTLNLKNIGAAPNYKKKCNIEVKEATLPKIIEVKRVAEVPLELDKTVQSPSKLNGNRRALVNETGPPLNMPSIFPVLTPEIEKAASCVIPPSTGKRSIISLLETPCKECPKTPSIFSPASTLETPFTKAINEHLSHIDILSIETPKLPLTPNFAITPLLDTRETPASHRLTDYSTSSSYYQPSDSEQNKSLEQFIKEECKRSDVKNATPPQPEMESQPVPEAPIANKLNDVAQNVIGRKRLHLVDNKSTSALESSSSSNSGSSSSSSDGEWSDNDDNKSIIEAKDIEKEEQKPQKHVMSEVECAVASITTNFETTSQPSINALIHSDFIPSAKAQSSRTAISDSKKQFLNDLEEKRKRTIERMKLGIQDTFASVDSKEVAEKAAISAKLKSPRVSARIRSLRSHSIKADLRLSSDEEDNKSERNLNISGPDKCSSKGHVASETVKSDKNKLAKGEKSKQQIESTEIPVIKTDKKAIVVPIKKRAVTTKKPIKIKISPKKKVTKTQSKPKKSPAKPSTAKCKSDKVKKLAKQENASEDKQACLKSELASKPDNSNVDKLKPIKDDKTNDSKLEKSQIETKIDDSKVMKCNKAERKIVPKMNNLKDTKDAVTNERKASSVLAAQSEVNAEDEMLSDLKVRQIHLMRLPELQSTCKRQSDEQTSVPIETFDNSCVIINNVNHLGQCESMRDTPESQLIVFDTVHTSAEIHYVCNEKFNPKPRDYEDDQKRMMKEFGATVYDERNESEIEKKMTITPFQLLFEIGQEFFKPRKEKVKILNNILIEKGAKKEAKSTELVDCKQVNCAPIDDLHNADTNTQRNLKQGAKRSKVVKKPIETAKTEGVSGLVSNNKKDKKRKADTHPSKENNDGKKIKLCQELLKNINVDNVLDKLYE